MTRPPTPRAIPRPRLTAPLAATAGLPLVTVIAPAGYGKTTLLCDWADRDERSFAWVTLDAADNDPVCLHASVALAAERVEPGPFVLVLDDLQALHAPAAHAALAALLDGLPPEVTLAVASRTPAPLPIARMRSQGRVVELGAQELAMDAGEAAAMLERTGVALRHDDARGAARQHRGLAGGARARRARQPRGLRRDRPPGRRLRPRRDPRRAGAGAAALRRSRRRCSRRSPGSCATGSSSARARRPRWSRCAASTGC